MTTSITVILTISKIFLKEQVKEPSTLAWTIFSPAIFFHAINIGNSPNEFNDYLSISAWLYSYIVMNSVLLGMALYAVGRRESGFLRCFATTMQSKKHFIISHLTTHLNLTLAYVSSFYLLTRGPEHLNISEWQWILSNALILYLGLASLGILVSSIFPLRFSTANTIFSILLFTSLIIGMVSNKPSFQNHTLSLSPLHILLFTQGWQQHIAESVICATTFITTTFIACRFLRIAPIWSRHA